MPLRSNFDEFLRLHESDCFIKDYGHGALSFKRLASIYGNWYFTVIEFGYKLKILYFRGSQEKFKKRWTELFETIGCYYYTLKQKLNVTALHLFCIGYIPSLFTVDFSNDKIADAIRKDFIKYGFAAYDTGDNLLGNVCQRAKYFNVEEFKHARYLDFDFMKWLMERREATLKELRKEEESIISF